MFRTHFQTTRTMASGKRDRAAEDDKYEASPSKLQKTEKGGCVSEGKPIEEKKEFPLVVLGYLAKHQLSLGTIADVSAGATRFLLKKENVLFADCKFTRDGPIDWKKYWDSEIVAEIEKHPDWSPRQILLSAFVDRIIKTGHYGSYEVQILISSIALRQGISENPKRGADACLKEIDQVLGQNDNLRFRIHYHIRLGIPMLNFLNDETPIPMYHDVISESIEQAGGIKALKEAFPGEMSMLYNSAP